MAELVYHGTSMAEIAGLSWLQIRWLYFRDRDEHCRLVRPGAEKYRVAKVPGMGVGFTEGWWKSVVRSGAERMRGKVYDGVVFKGLTEEEIHAKWLKYLERNPALGARLNRKKTPKVQFKKSPHQFKPQRQNNNNAQLSFGSSDAGHQFKSDLLD